MGGLLRVEKKEKMKKEILIILQRVGSDLRKYLKNKGLSSYGLSCFRGKLTEEEIYELSDEAKKHSDFIVVYADEFISVNFVVKA